MSSTSTLAEFKIRQVPAATLITDFVALVIQPDGATIRKSYELAASLMPRSPEQAVASGWLPHITLTQCALRDAPRDRCAAFVDRLEAELRGRTIPLRTVTAFGGGFMFWCVDPTSPARQDLQRAHEYAITIADGFLDPVANAAVVDATIKVTNNDPGLVANARACGYAFVRDRYLPHITLGFDPRLVVDRNTGSTFANQDHVHSMTVDHVVLAKLGSRGRVDHVLTV